MLAAGRGLGKIVRFDEKVLYRTLFTTQPKNSTESKNLAATSDSKDKPVKFTSSGAHVAYKASRNFYGDDRDLPQSHNMVLATSFISSIFYLIFLRDDIDEDGGKNLAKPVYETVPQIAIPLLQAAIVENRKQGLDTKKMERKLAEYMKEPEKYGMARRKLIEN